VSAKGLVEKGVGRLRRVTRNPRTKKKDGPHRVPPWRGKIVVASKKKKAPMGKAGANFARVQAWTQQKELKGGSLKGAWYVPAREEKRYHDQNTLKTRGGGCGGEKSESQPKSRLNTQNSGGEGAWWKRKKIQHDFLSGKGVRKLVAWSS